MTLLATFALSPSGGLAVPPLASIEAQSNFVAAPERTVSGGVVLGGVVQLACSVGPPGSATVAVYLVYGPPGGAPAQVAPPFVLALDVGGPAVPLVIPTGVVSSVATPQPALWGPALVPAGSSLASAEGAAVAPPPPLVGACLGALVMLTAADAPGSTYTFTVSA